MKENLKEKPKGTHGEQSKKTPEKNPEGNSRKRTISNI